MPVLQAVLSGRHRFRRRGRRFTQADCTAALGCLGLLVVGLGLVVVIGLTTVGVLMAVSMLVLPAVAARLLATTTSQLLGLSIALGASAGLAGLLLSYHLALPTGPAVSLVAAKQVLLAAAARRTPLALRRTVVADLDGHR